MNSGVQGTAKLLAAILFAMQASCPCSGDLFEKTLRGYTLGENCWNSLDSIAYAASVNDPKAMYALGWMYGTGTDLAPNRPSSLQWFARSRKGLEQQAEKMDIDAMMVLGEMYKLGHGVPVDYGKAFEWYRQAAVSGQPDAMYQVAESYELGRGVARDEENALAWYWKAAEGGSAEAMLWAGDRCMNGTGLDQDKPAGIGWYMKACRAGSVEAFIRLARCYERGDGVRKDRDEAQKLRRTAALKSRDVSNRSPSFTKFR